MPFTWPARARPPRRRARPAPRPSCTSRPSAPTASTGRSTPAPRRRAKPPCWPSSRAPSSCGRRWCSGRRTSSSTALPPWRGCSPFLPLIGGGKTRFQPVYVGDVAAAIAAACAGKAKPRTIYELGGPDIVTFRQLLDLVQEWSGRRRRYLRLPVLAGPDRRVPDAAVAARAAAPDGRPGAHADAPQRGRRGRRQGRTHTARSRHRQPARHGQHRAGLPRSAFNRTASSRITGADRGWLGAVIGSREQGSGGDIGSSHS